MTSCLVVVPDGVERHGNGGIGDWTFRWVCCCFDDVLHMARRLATGKLRHGNFDTRQGHFVAKHAKCLYFGAMLVM